MLALVTEYRGCIPLILTSVRLRSPIFNIRKRTGKRSVIHQLGLRLLQTHSERLQVDYCSSYQGRKLSSIRKVHLVFSAFRLNFETEYGNIEDNQSHQEALWLLSIRFSPMRCVRMQASDITRNVGYSQVS